MSNYNAKINLLQLKKAKVVSDSSLGKCVLIPVEDNEIFLSDKGNAYLSLSVREMKNSRYGQSHFIKRRVSKDAYKRMSEDERNNIPIIGQLEPVGNHDNNNNENSQASAPKEDIPW